MLWDYSYSSNNNGKVQFLLPSQETLDGYNQAAALPQNELTTAENQQILQELCQEFLTQLGYSVISPAVTPGFEQQPALPSINPQSLDDMFSILHTLAVCAASREHSVNPMTLFNRLLGNIHQITQNR